MNALTGSMTIHRFPNLAGLKRGPNMARKFCQKCHEEKTHGFWFYDEEVLKCALFVCDDCLESAKKGVQ